MPHSTDPEKAAIQRANLRNAPAAPEGNRRRATHGGYGRVARERMEAKALAVFDALSEDAPLTERGGLPAADAAMVRLLAECLCRIEGVSEWLTLHGMLGEDGEPRAGVLELERKLRAEAAGYLDALGMTPRSRAKLGVDIRAATVDVSQAMSEPDPVIRAQLLRRLGLLDELTEGAEAGE
jgi:hypothetical protein